MKALINISLLLSSACVIFSAAHAVDKATNNPTLILLEQRISTLEETNTPYPPARPYFTEGGGAYFSGDLLYWYASVNGLPYSISNKGGSTFINHGKMHNARSTWDQGFRVGFGYQTTRDTWDFVVYWTRYYSSSPTHAKIALGQGVIFPTLTNPTAPRVINVLDRSHAHWKVHLNLIDLEIGREFLASKFLAMRPFIGPRTAWVSHLYRVRYYGIDVPPRFTDRVQMSSEFFGMGVRAGLNTEWRLKYGLSLYGNGALSLLYGRFLIQDQERVSSSSTNVERLSVLWRYKQSVATTDLGAGVRYHVGFFDEDYHLDLQLGYEQHYFPSQNALMFFNDDTAPGIFSSRAGDISFNGWTFSLRLDF